MKVIKDDTNDVTLKALGDDRWGYLGMESVGHQVNNLTLKDIIEGLAQREREMLTAPFSFDDPSVEDYRRNNYLHYHWKISRFNIDESDEDIERVLQFFLFDHMDFGSFLLELGFFTVEEGLLKLLDDKYLRQHVEDVDGYMVPETLAPVLKTLLHKYGDLGGKEGLSSAMKSITSTLLCIVIDKMCKTKLEDITREDLKHCWFYLRGIGRITGFEIQRFVPSWGSDFGLKAFLGLQTIRYEKDTCKYLDKEIMELEAKLERCKKNRDKFETHRSRKSDFIEGCLSEASEWEHKYWGDM